jgi:alcohol dehydrogenase
MLPHVIRFNAAGDATASAIYAELSRAAGLVSADVPEAAAVSALAETIERFLVGAGFARTLEASGVERARLPALAAEAARQWTAQFNPRPVTEADFAALFAAAYEGGG